MAIDPLLQERIEQRCGKNRRVDADLLSAPAGELADSVDLLVTDMPLTRVRRRVAALRQAGNEPSLLYLLDGEREHHEETLPQEQDDAGWRELMATVFARQQKRQGLPEDFPQALIDEVIQAVEPAPAELSDPKLRLLVVTPGYPSTDNRYSNGFVHSRVRDYVELGHEVEVFSMRGDHEYQHGVYEGVSVYRGKQEDLLEFITTHTGYDAILVHFPVAPLITPVLDAALKGIQDCPIIAWLHGFETEAWHRRWFNFLTTTEETTAALERRTKHFPQHLNHMRTLYTRTDVDVSFVNVSAWFQEAIVEPDAKTRIARSAVIPNVIDRGTFGYRAKSPDLRYKVLSLRPYASSKYANDLTAAAIHEAAGKPWFDKFEFTIAGDGVLFESITEPLKKYPNVTVRQGFFNHTEIRELHANHGIFLSPTRFDSQGVSACEAMASGLVPLSTNTASIPEFITDGETGLLAPLNNYRKLVEHLETLHEDPELFARLSANASASMAKLCGKQAATWEEIRYIRQRIAEHPNYQDHHAEATAALALIDWEARYRELENQTALIVAETNRIRRKIETQATNQER